MIPWINIFFLYLDQDSSLNVFISSFHFGVLFFLLNFSKQLMFDLGKRNPFELKATEFITKHDLGRWWTWRRWWKNSKKNFFHGRKKNIIHTVWKHHLLSFGLIISINRIWQTIRCTQNYHTLNDLYGKSMVFQSNASTDDKRIEYFSIFTSIQMGCSTNRWFGIRLLLKREREKKHTHTQNNYYHSGVIMLTIESVERK